MAARRPPTTDQKAALDEAARLYTLEREAKIAAKAEAAALIEARMGAARKATNEALWHVANNLNVNRTMISQLCLGTSDRQQLYRRLREVEGLPDVAPVVLSNKVEPQVGSMIVEPHDDGLTVHMTDYTHPDLGPNMNGFVVFDKDGDVTASDGDVAEAIALNPIWALTLWGMPQVQEHA